MKKNLDEAIKVVNDLKNGIVCGIKVKYVPEVGMGCTRPSGSDSYGYQVLTVAPDRRTFTYGRIVDGVKEERGMAALVTRKNSCAYGIYREAWYDDNGRLKISPVNHCVRCESFGDVYLTGEYKEAETYLDPSF